MSETHNNPHGVGHWIKLRLSAVALIPMSIWAVYSVLEISTLDHASFTLWLQNPYNAALLIIFLLVSFYHGALGTQEVIEDYVACEKMQKAAIIVLYLAFIALTIISLFSIVKVAF